MSWSLQNVERKGTQVCKCGLSPIARTPYGAALRPLEGQVLCVSSNLDITDYTSRSAYRVAEELGATVEIRFRKDATHVITSRADYCRKSAKVNGANKFRIPIIRALWLVECDRLQEFAAIDTQIWATVLDEEERLEEARDCYHFVQ